MVTQFNADLSPFLFFHSSDKPNQEFNRVLDAEIEKTKNYTYFSNRSFIIIRRILNHPVQGNFSFFLPDIDERKIFNACAIIMQKRGKAESNSSSIRMDAFKSIYYLKKLMGETENINIYLHKEIPFIRFELTDNYLALSFLPMITEAQPFPPALIYKRSSLFAQTFDTYSKQITERSRKLDIGNIDEYLRKAYRTYRISSEKYEEYCKKLDIEFEEMKKGDNI